MKTGAATNDSELPDSTPQDHAAEESEEVHARDLQRMARFLIPFLRPRRRQLLALAAVLLVETIFNFSFPLTAQLLVDEGLIERNVQVVIGVLVFLGVAAVMVMLLGLACDYLHSRIFATVVLDIRQRLFAHVQTLSISYFMRTQSGVVLSRFSGDMVAIEGSLITCIPWLVVPLLEVIYSTILMFIFNVWLGLLGSLVFPLIFFAPHFFAARAFRLSYDKRRQEAKLLSAVQENVAAQPIVKAFTLQKLAEVRFHALNTAWLRTAFRVNFFSALVERSANTGVYVIHLLIFGLGAYWAFIGEITIGTLVAFESTFLTMGYALTVVTQYTPTLAQAAGGVQHLDALFAEQPQIVDAPTATPLLPFQHEIRLDHVGFRYPDGSFEVTNVDVAIPKGSFVAFVGASGSGKSTLLNLLLRFHDPTHGAILIDGHDLRSITQESLRTQIGIVFQESFLFNANIADNIRMGRPDASMEQVAAAARAAEIHDFITTLPDGYDTVVGERGSQLSGGQRQRLAIGRALVRDPAILILDEATSALDYGTEAALNDTLFKVAHGRTVIAITHRLPSVVAADRIIVMDMGRVVESGTHGELLRKLGHYAALWKQQGFVSRSAGICT